jgi:hypothetical protein
MGSMAFKQASVAWEAVAEYAGQPAEWWTTAPRREQLARRRLRLATWRRALEGSAAVVATGPEVRDGLERWLAVRAQVIAPEPAGDAAAAYAELYRALVG